VFDPSRRTTDDRNIRLRGAFYTWQVLFESPANETMGFVAIRIIRAPNNDKIVAKAVQKLLSVFPIKAKVFHTFDLMTKINLFCRGFIQGLIGSIVRAYTATPAFFHLPHGAEETLCNLERQYGLPRTVIPNCIGGSWSYDCLEEFQMECIVLERTSYSTRAECATTSATIPSQAHLAHGAAAGSSPVISEQSLRRNYHDGKI